MREDLKDLFKFLQEEIAKNRLKNTEILLAFNKKDPNLILYGQFSKYKEQSIKGNREYTRYKIESAFLILYQDGEYLYDDYSEEEHNYDINKDFKF